MNDTTRVLVVDDDASFRRSWARLLATEGYSVVDAADATEGYEAFRSNPDVRLVVLDLMMPPEGTAEAGAKLLERLLAVRPGTKVIVASGTGEAALALKLVRAGAYDFLQKPVDPDVLLAVLERARVRLALEDRVRELEDTLAATPDDVGLVGNAVNFVDARTLAERAAATLVPVLLTGESGTGKEVFARWVHARSPRAKQPFVAVNCGAISPQLLESTLFGHRKGAFTGATADQKGLFVEADGGTLFLDELGDLALDLQVKLLRVLESGEVLPVGASKPQQVDVRLVSATHRPLAEMVAAKTFRDDLYWRVRGIEVQLPRLADRPGDVVLLAQHFLNQARALVPGRPLPKLTPAAIRLLETHSWPGNLRELRHELQRAIVVSAGRGEILPEDLSPALQGKGVNLVDTSREPKTLDEKVEALERREIGLALQACDGNRTQVAERLGISRQGLLNKLARYGLR